MVRDINQNQFSSCRGSSLLGLALLMLAIGFLMTGAIYLYQNYDVIVSDQTSVDNSRDVEIALKNFATIYGRYPCPAPLNAAPDSPTFGKETSGSCSGALLSGTYRAQGRGGEPVVIGAVPVRTLNIADSKMMDGYGQRFVYAITEKLATNAGDLQVDEGAIYINNENGNPVSDRSGFIIYALISSSNDSRGAFDEQGALVLPCEGGTDAWNNCDFLTDPSPNATFLAHSQKTWGMGSSSISHSFAFMAKPAVYKWHTDAWDPCDGVCFSGDQNRNVNCRDYRGTVVGDVLCSHTPRPVDYRLCGLPPCYWDAGPWRNCTAGTGINAGGLITGG